MTMIVSKSTGLLVAAITAGVLLVAATGCSSDDDQPTEAEAALLADESYGEETFDGADLGGQAEIDDDAFGLAVTSLDGDRAKLGVFFGQGSELNKEVEVELGSVFTAGPDDLYRIRVVTVDERGVAWRWAKRDS